MYLTYVWSISHHLEIFWLLDIHVDLLDCWKRSLQTMCICTCTCISISVLCKYIIFFWSIIHQSEFHIPKLTFILNFNHCSVRIFISFLVYFQCAVRPLYFLLNLTFTCYVHVCSLTGFIKSGTSWCNPKSSPRWREMCSGHHETGRSALGSVVWRTTSLAQVLCQYSQGRNFWPSKVWQFKWEVTSTAYWLHQKQGYWCSDRCYWKWWDIHV